jgi:hypothetical protein
MRDHDLGTVVHGENDLLHTDLVKRTKTEALRERKERNA